MTCEWCDLDAKFYDKPLRWIDSARTCLHCYFDMLDVGWNYGIRKQDERRRAESTFLLEFDAVA